MDIGKEDLQRKEHMPPLEFDVVRFVMDCSKSGRYKKVIEIELAAQEAFAECAPEFIRQCIAKVGESLR